MVHPASFETALAAARPHPRPFPRWGKGDLGTSCTQRDLVDAPFSVDRTIRFLDAIVNLAKWQCQGHVHFGQAAYLSGTHAGLSLPMACSLRLSKRCRCSRSMASAAVAPTRAFERRSTRATYFWPPVCR